MRREREKPEEGRREWRGREGEEGEKKFPPYVRTHARGREGETRERMGREGERFSLPLASPRDGKFCRERERERERER